MNYQVALMVLLSLTSQIVLSKTPDQNYVKRQSQRVENLIDHSIYKRFNQLVSVTTTKGTPFKYGHLKINSKGLSWRNKFGIEEIIVPHSSQRKNHKVSGFLVGPKANLIAFYSTFNGQDLKFWNVYDLKNDKILLEKPIENRMQGFTWDRFGEGLYYSYWYPKADVTLGKKPILEVRYRSLKTQKDFSVFSPHLAENFEVSDLDGGDNIVAYRVLNPSSGIKTTFSLYKGIRQKNNKYTWNEIYPRNKHVAVYLGRTKNSILLQTDALGDTYGVESINAITGKKRTIIKALKNHVLHTANYHEGKLILQYHHKFNQAVSLKLYDLKENKLTDLNLSQFKLSSFGNLTRFVFATGAKKGEAIFSDVYLGNKKITLNLETNTLSLSPSQKKYPFDSKDIQSRLVKFNAKDGTLLTGRLYTRKSVAPQFVFMRYYGWISIKNSPEPREIQLALELSGAYLSIHLPGGGERGSKWFIDGSRNRLKMIKYIDEASSFIQKELSLPKEKVAAMGRSWGGLTSLILLAKHAKNFGFIFPVVPVIDLEDMFINGWFGRIAHSDLAPEIDAEGNYILDSHFFDYVKSISPLRVLNEINPGPIVGLFTNGLDDRVDQGGAQEAQFAYDLQKRVQGKNFYYHRGLKGNHANRFYQVLIFSILKNKLNLTHKTLN